MTNLDPSTSRKDSLVQYLTAMLAFEHLNDLLREAEAERRSALVRGARRSSWSLAVDRVGGLVRWLVDLGRRVVSGRRSVGQRPTGPRPATT